MSVNHQWQIADDKWGWPLRLVFIGLIFIVIACDPTATSSPTAAPARQPIAQPSNTPTVALTRTPTATYTPIPSPTPVPSLKRLTDGQCCTQPFWSPNSEQVLFIDKPDAKAPTGIYAVDIATPIMPKLLTERVAFYTGDLKYAITPEGAFTIIEQLSDGQKWRIRTGGRTVLLSPDRTRVVWNETPQTGAFETRMTAVMGATLRQAQGDGSDARPITTLLRGGATAWLDDQRLLMTARLNRNSQDVMLFIYSLADGSTKELVKSERLRTVLPSPTGEWLAYSIVFDKNPEQSGLWLIRTNGGPAKKLDVFGSFQWRDGHRLIYVPLELDKASHAFYEFDANTGAQRRLTDPTFPFKISNGDWTISPDGRKIVFLEAKDLNLWLWTFPN